jgi:hypothetical protein
MWSQTSKAFKSFRLQMTTVTVQTMRERKQQQQKFIMQNFTKEMKIKTKKKKPANTNKKFMA